MSYNYQYQTQNQTQNPGINNQNGMIYSQPLAAQPYYYNTNNQLQPTNSQATLPYPSSYNNTPTNTDIVMGEMVVQSISNPNIIPIPSAPPAPIMGLELAVNNNRDIDIDMIQRGIKYQLEHLYLKNKDDNVDSLTTTMME